MSVRSQLRGRAHQGRPRVGNETVIDLRDHVLEREAREQVRVAEEQAQLREVKFFGSPAFRRLWFSQIASSLGDWIGLVAITAIADRIGGSGAAGLGGVSLVLAARLVPGFFFSPIAGVMIDRFNRKLVMVVCDFGRGAVLCCLPLVHNLAGLFLASLLLELFTLLWSTAKDASVPNLVPKSFLPTANSLGLAAAYGPLLIAPGLFGLLAKLPEWLDLSITNESLALYFDAFTYLLSAAVIATLSIPHIVNHHKDAAGNETSESSLKAAREGLSYVAHNARVRSVMFGLAAGLIGGAMVVPLGHNFADQVLTGGNGAYGLLLTGLGSGVAISVLALTVLQKHLPIEKTFMVAVLGAGASLIAAASMSGLTAAVICVSVLGICGGAVYVLGYTSVQINTVDEMRGRVFATLYTATRMCILLALVAAPLLAVGLGQLSDTLLNGKISVLGAKMMLPGVRLTLWLGGLIVLIAGVLAAFSLRRGLRAVSE